MSNNKRPPKGVQRYIVVRTEKRGAGVLEEYHYSQTQKEAREWAKNKPGVKRLFKITYDYYGELK